MFLKLDFEKIKLFTTTGLQGFYKVITLLIVEFFYGLSEVGKIGIHLGGAIQILFGIKGGRWDKHEIISTFYNESWVRPDGNEVPKYAHLIENNCFW